MRSKLKATPPLPVADFKGVEVAPPRRSVALEAAQHAIIEAPDEQASSTVTSPISAEALAVRPSVPVYGDAAGAA